MGQPSLFEQLEGRFISCNIDGKTFMPRGDLESIISKENVRAEMKIKDGVLVKARLRKPSDLPDRVAGQAKRIFAALVVMDKVAAIEGLLDEGLTDEHLPLTHHPNPDHDAFLSIDGSTVFHFKNWGGPTVKEFIQIKQWLFVSPVLDTTGQLIHVNQNCALPFTESEFSGSGAAAVVHRAKLHQAHQRGFEAETDGFLVAVKEFHKKAEFDKENETLQQIKALPHRHIIQHFVSIDKGVKDKGKGEGKGYIIFPWAAGGNLHDFWEHSVQEPSQERVLWSLQQMLGLTTALHMLHEHFKCRHGDLKPGNILCVKEGEETVLKLADFGISKIHSAQTAYRKIATTTAYLTPSYQGPEVEFEKTDELDQRPRSRKYDIWSLGCVFLELAIWVLYGPRGIEDFFGARGNSTSSSSSSSPLYSVTNKASKSAIVHELVSWTIGKLENNPPCEGDTALAALLHLIKNKMLKPEVDERPSAADVCRQLEIILQEAEKRPSYLFNSPAGLVLPNLDFEEFHSDFNSGK
ncbi:kinase-like domain-containing protein [Amylocarpus encephaloides]|uniref:Kinase-like domain-containing protein n=1 Tax=Amylocarpus encephaloides TaxID=45428 RepID=A0A9P7Y7Q8_9HELO|nr:kinase-like domain-containing protein [Amylocarpus encephaloides]